MYIIVLRPLSSLDTNTFPFFCFITIVSILILLLMLLS